MTETLKDTLALEVQEPRSQAGLIREEAESLVIATADDKARADERLAAVRTAVKAIEKKRKEKVEPLNTEVKLINEAYGGVRDILKQADDLFEAKILKWHRAESDRIEAERRRILKEQQDKEAEAQRLRKVAEDEAERVRLAALAVENAQTLGEFHDAEDRLQQTRREAAPTMLAAAEAHTAAVTGTVLQTPPPRVVETARGTLGIRKHWTWKVTDELLVPRNLMILNGPEITKAVQAGARNPEIPGIDIFEEESLAQRASR